MPALLPLLSASHRRRKSQLNPDFTVSLSFLVLCFPNSRKWVSYLVRLPGLSTSQSLVKRRRPRRCHRGALSLSSDHHFWCKEPSELLFIQYGKSTSAKFYPPVPCVTLKDMAKIQFFLNVEQKIRKSYQQRYQQNFTIQPILSPKTRLTDFLQNVFKQAGRDDRFVACCEREIHIMPSLGPRGVFPAGIEPTFLV